MEEFLIIASLILVAFGSFMFLFPEGMKRVASVVDRIPFAIGAEKIPALRRSLGLVFLGISVICWYLALAR